MNFVFHISHNSKPNNMSRTFSFRNQFSVLEEQKNKSRTQQKPKPKRRRHMEAFPRLPGSSKHVNISDNVTQLSYNNLIPSLNEWKMKKSSKSSHSYDSKPCYATTSEEENDEFNQVWCVEKDKCIVFDSDLYPEEDTDSFTYDSDNSY